MIDSYTSQTMSSMNIKTNINCQYSDSEGSVSSEGKIHEHHI
jgi:hypothetical protein